MSEDDTRTENTNVARLRLDAPIPAGGAEPSPSALAAAAVDEADTVPTSRLSVFQISLLVAGTFGAAMAYLVPMVFTLALKIDRIDPGNAAALGYILGAGSVVALLATPLTGVLSDRTRSRWGRRRPFTFGGAVIGVAAVLVMAMASDFIVLGAGWLLANLGWGTAVGSIANVQADRLPPAQRGKVAALVGVVTQTSPVAGILLLGPFAADIALSMWLPVLVGGPLVLLFILFFHDEDSRQIRFEQTLTVGRLFKSFVFRPSAFPDFAWNLVGRFLVFTGITFTTTYATFFISSRLELPVQQIAPFVALTSAIGVTAASIGAISSGALSDRLGRRRPFILVAVVLYAGGTVISSVAYDPVTLIIGGVVTTLGTAVFVAINQAMILDVLPHRDTQAGRFMGIVSFSQKIPNAVAPLIAPLLLSIGVAEGQNFMLLYLAAGGLVFAGGVVIITRVRSVR